MNEIVCEPIRKIRSPADGYLAGTVKIAGTFFHAEFFRVKWVGGENGRKMELDIADTETRELGECLMQVHHPNEIPERIGVIGHPGEWVLFIHPFGV